MPTYEYTCDDCGRSYEKFQSMSAEPDTECPKCKGKVRRLIGTGAGLIFKGSGFYQTDYKKASKPSSECSSCAEGPT
ncbi:FmdB family transcriptional regulator [Candidatus Fermentibacteria bacterium]|nr:MAG: FmdB family transcriptional regulator [Candidatus Fermentibacteria bacterium]